MLSTANFKQFYEGVILLTLYFCILFSLIAFLCMYFVYNSTSYTMGCLPVREDNPRALASGLSYVQADNPWYNYFIPPTSV